MIVGVTGRIATGKSLVAKISKGYNYTVFDADRLVRQLLINNEALKNQVFRYFPNVFLNNQIDRKHLKQIVFIEKEKMALLETLVHPYVLKEKAQFIQKQKTLKNPHCLLEIPLLFETQSHLDCDCVLYLKTDKHLQKERLLERGGLTEEMIQSILNMQGEDTKKASLSDHVIENNSSQEQFILAVKTFFEEINERNYS